jgi:hypothetical protein
MSLTPQEELLLQQLESDPELMDSQPNLESDLQSSIKQEMIQQPNAPKPTDLKRDEFLTQEKINGIEFNVVNKAEPESLIQQTNAALADGALFNWAGELEAGVQTLYELPFTDNISLSSAKALYHRNVKEFNKQRSIFKADHPVIDFGAEAVGNSITGGPLLKTLGASIKGSMALGAVSGVGMSEGDSIKEDAISGLGGAIVGGAVQKAVNAISPIASMSAGNLNDAAKNFLSAMKLNSNSTATGAVNSRTRYVQDTLNARKRDVYEWAKSVVVGADGQLIAKPGEGIVQISENAKKSLNMYGKDLSDIIDLASNKLQVSGSNPNIQTTRVLDSIKSIVDEVSPDILASSPGLQTNAALKKMSKDLWGIMQPHLNSPEISLSDAQKLRGKLTNAFNTWENTIKDVSMVKTRAAAQKINLELRDFIKSKIGQAGPDISAAFESTNTKWADFSIFAASLQAPANQAKFQTVEESMTLLQKLGKSLNGNNMFSSLGGGGKVIGNALKNTALKSAGAVIADSQTDLLAQNISKSSQSLYKIGEKLANSPQFTPIAYRLLSAASIGNSDRFLDVIGDAEAEINLTEIPLQRNSQDIINRMDDVSNIIQNYAPEAFDLFLTMSNQNDLEGIKILMSELSRQPGMSKFVEKGSGWDGKACSPYDFDEAELQIRQSNQNPTIKSQQLKELQELGTLPVFQPKSNFQRMSVKQKRLKSGAKQLDM